MHQSDLFGTHRFIIRGGKILRKYMVWLLIALFCWIDLFSHAGIIYTERDNSDGADIIHLKNGRQVEGRVIERGPDQVKIEVTSDSGNKKNVYTYRANDVERVEALLTKEKANILWRIAKGCFWAYVGIMAVALALASPLTE